MPMSHLEDGGQVAQRLGAAAACVLGHRLVAQHQVTHLRQCQEGFERSVDQTSERRWQAHLAICIEVG